MAAVGERVSPFIQTVCEADIDWILCIELNSNPQFRQWLGETFLSFESLAHERAWRSVCDSELGESDLVWQFRDLNGKSYLALFEDKIHAGPQPLQHERYVERGRRYAQKHECDDFRVVLVSPEGYTSSESGLYEHRINYEELRDWFKRSEGERAEFMAALFQAGIDKFHRNGVQVVDQEVTAFRQAYSTYCERVCKDSCLDIEPDRPRPAYWGDTWFTFRRGFLRNGVYINHKAPWGFVDLTFPNTNVENLSFFQPELPAGMTIHQTGKSSAIRLVVPKIERFDDFAREQPKVVEALSAVRTLLGFYAEEHERLETACHCGLSH
jgi:hypothetical protein